MYYIVSEKRENAHWVRNIMANPRIKFSVGTGSNPEEVVKTTSAVGKIIVTENDADIVAEVSAKMNQKYNWSDGLIVQILPSAPE